MRNFNLSIDLIIQLILSILFSVLIILDLGVKANQVLLVVAFFECFIVASRKGFFNVYQILLFMLFFFNLSIPIFNFLGIYDYPAGNMFNYNAGIRTPITDETLSKTYCVLIFVLLGISIGWLLTLNKNSEKQTNKNISEIYIDERINGWKWIRFCFFAFIPFELIYESILVRFSIDEGYVATMHLHSYVGTVSNILVYIDYLYPFIGLLAIYQCKEQKEYKKFMILFLLPYTVQMLTGLRGNFISMFLALLFIYSHKYKKITLRKAAILAAIVFVAIIIIGAVRFSHDVSDVKNAFSEGIFQTVINEICSNGESIAVLSYTIQLLGSFTNKIPFLFGYISAIFSFASNYSIEGILSKSYLAQHITYMLNPAKLLGGSTIGTAISAEFYELGRGSYLVVFILSIFLMVFATYFIKRLYKSPIWFYLGVIYLQNLFLSPRGSVMKIFNKLSLLYLVTYLIITWTVNRKIRISDNHYL